MSIELISYAYTSDQELPIYQTFQVIKQHDANVTCHVFQQTDLKQSLYSWKPELLKQKLACLKDNDMIVYLDIDMHLTIEQYQLLLNQMTMYDVIVDGTDQV